MQFPSLNTPADVHLTLTSAVHWAKCGLENEWQPLKQINYASTKLLAHVHRAGLALRAGHTPPYGVCKNGHAFFFRLFLWGGVQRYTPEIPTDIYFSAWVTEDTHICCKIPQNESNVTFRWLLLGRLALHFDPSVIPWHSYWKWKCTFARFLLPTGWKCDCSSK